MSKFARYYVEEYIICPIMRRNECCKLSIEGSIDLCVVFFQFLNFSSKLRVLKHLLERKTPISVDITFIFILDHNVQLNAAGQVSHECKNTYG